MKSKRRRFLKRISGAAISAAFISGCAPTSKRTVSDTQKVEPTASIDKVFDAIVVGAGLSGLHAAMILEESGLDVLVLEGRNRLGGRVYTLDNVPGKPEAGGEYMGANYARMRNVVDKLGLETFTPEFNNETRPWSYNIKGQHITKANWESHPLNPLEGEDRKLLPHRFLWTLSDKNNPLDGHGLDAWLTPEFAKYDIPNDRYMRSIGLNEETIRLMNVTIHSGGMTRTSALNELRRYHVSGFNSNMTFTDGTSWKQVAGGNSLLPKGMAESLQLYPLLDKTAVAFQEADNIVTVHCADGTNYKASNVVCSIPMTVLKNVTFEPEITGVTYEAINQIQYGLSIQAHYLITEPYWKKDGLDPNIWTDGPLERFAVRSKRDPAQPESAVAFINGPESFKFRLMSDDEIFKYIESLVIDLRPSAKGKLEPLMIQSCERDIHGAGDWVVWQPGQVKKFGNHMRKSHGRIHFAGEHTAIMERGMEGAFESGERAALDILLAS